MRYPTDSRGLAYPIEEVGYEEAPYTRRRTSNHHRYFEKRKYMGSQIAKMFRGLEPHVQTMWLPEHSRLHQEYDAPRIPDRKLMKMVLDDYAEQHGELHIVREQNTNEIYTIPIEHWRLLRDGTRAY